LPVRARHFAVPGPSKEHLKASSFIPEGAFSGVKVALCRLCPQTPGGIDWLTFPRAGFVSHDLAYRNLMSWVGSSDQG